MSGFSGKRLMMGSLSAIKTTLATSRASTLAQLQAVLPQHESPVDEHDVEGDKEEDGGRQDFEKLVPHRPPDLAHVSLRRSRLALRPRILRLTVVAPLVCA